MATEPPLGYAPSAPGSLLWSSTIRLTTRSRALGSCSLGRRAFRSRSRNSGGGLLPAQRFSGSGGHLLPLDELANKWHASVDVATFGPEIQIFEDPAGRQFDAALRRIVRTISDGFEDAWRDLLSAARLIRWRRIFD